MVLILIAFVAGALSVLTPCVLPLLPSMLAFSSGNGRRRVWGLVAGIEVSFIGLTLLLAGAVRSLGLREDVLQKAGAAVLVAFGIVLIVPPLEAAFQRFASRLVSRLPQLPGSSGDGFAGGFFGGLSLGLVWAPCAGPILASVAVAASTDSFDARTVAMALAFGAGMFGPLLAIAIGGRHIGERLRRRLGGGSRVLVPAGALLVLTGAMIWTGQLNRINEGLAEAVQVRSLSESLEQRVLERDTEQRIQARGAGGSGGGDELPPPEVLAETGYPASEDGRLHDLGPAPSFAGIQRWYNTKDGKPLTPADLEGKVVLVDFWTYSCINCIRTLPYIRQWHDRYADDGLVIVGVHTPEFDFEKREENVRGAIEEFDLEYAVATDPGFATWDRFHNRYWPAKYLIDRDGTLRYVHYGEGEYDTTEELIRELLAVEMDAPAGETDCAGGSQLAANRAATDACTEAMAGGAFHARTPETYLGYGRLAANQYASTTRSPGALRPDLPVPDREASYARRPGALAQHQYALTGRWAVSEERAKAGADAQLLLHYGAQRIFLVLAPPADGSGVVRVTDSAGESRTIEVDDERLYTLRDADEWVDGTLRLSLSPGTSAYAFTFG